MTLLALVALTSNSAHFERLDHLVLDTGSRLIPHPSHPNIVIIDIDDKSIAAIGRWPWRRALHAEMIRLVEQQNPKAIGLDILFTEIDQDYPEDDILLEQAIRKNGHITLPLTMQMHGDSALAILPIEPLANAAKALGHVHRAIDTDGVTRSTYLQEGHATQMWPNFSLAIACSIAQPETRFCKPDKLTNFELIRHGYAEYLQNAPLSVTPWIRKNREIIAFAGAPNHFTSYSYIDVLRGNIPAQALAGKYVLVGTSASGVGDVFATPLSHTDRLMPGVEIWANILNNILYNTHIVVAADQANQIFNLIPVATALVALLFLSPFATLLSIAALLFGLIATAMLMPSLMGLQFTPAAGIVGLILLYPLWSWRRLTAVTRYLGLEQQRFFQSPENATNKTQPQFYAHGDFLDKRINVVEEATEQLRHLHRFVNDTLQQLPDAALAINRKGHIILANKAAENYFNLSDRHLLEGQFIDTLFTTLNYTATPLQAITINALKAGALPAEGEVKDLKNRVFLFKCVAFSDASNQTSGWLISLIDLTSVRMLQQQRDNALRFISHDIRAPHSSILTLIELYQDASNLMSHEALLERIARQATNALDMAENFVELAQAEFQNYDMQAIDLVALLNDVIDDVWAITQKHRITIQVTQSPTHAFSLGDRVMLNRMLRNIVGNAIKFSPSASTIECKIEEKATEWRISIRDQGPGIAPKDQSQIFEAYKRLHSQTHPHIQGTGLGLTFVHTVVRRHSGSIEIDSQLTKGATFKVTLPKLQEPDSSDQPDA